MFWCDYCKVWMQDNPHAKAVHEKGIKHQERVEKSKAGRLLQVALCDLAARWLRLGNCDGNRTPGYEKKGSQR